MKIQPSDNRRIHRIHILLESYDLRLPYLESELKKILKPTHTAAIVAFSFRDSCVKSITDWNELYGKESGKLYGRIVDGFCAYGIPEENITFINYFTDTKETAARKIRSADIVYFPGGLPDRMMERIREFQLIDVLAKHSGIVMGYSAGALVQLAEYHLSPDEDYPAFLYDRGLPFLDSFFLEVHYTGSPEQKESIRRVLAERGKTVYATSLMNGAIIAENGCVRLIGDVQKFTQADDVP